MMRDFTKHSSMVGSAGIIFSPLYIYYPYGYHPVAIGTTLWHTGTILWVILSRGMNLIPCFNFYNCLAKRVEGFNLLMILGGDEDIILCFHM